jgi:membrane-associated protease RseP (regulator of RpoE activity)
MINMDMVGRLGQGPLIVYGIGTATEWKRIVIQATDAQQIEAKLIEDGYGSSDHTSFYLKDIPVLHFFTNVHADYHKPSDDWEKIDAPGLLKVSAIISDVVGSIANQQTTLTLVKGVGKPPAAAGASRGNAAYLGTVPDFTPVPKGVKLSGVGDGSPAQKAGLKAGDIIVRFDDTEIADLQAMSDALHERKPDDVVKITVLREGKEVVLTATLGKR